MYITREERDPCEDNMQMVNAPSLLDSIIVTNRSTLTRLYALSNNGYITQIWRINPVMQRHWTASLFLPVGSIIFFGIIVLLMVLFRRYPHTTIMIIMAILSIIIIFTTLTSMQLNHGPIYT